MGGVYENGKDRAFEFELDENLCNSILFKAGGDQIKALPKSYYTLSSPNKIIIPKGQLNGGIEVQLTDAFFADPLAIKNTYVVPLKLKSSTDVDSILVGSSPNPAADIRVASQWTITPKNFTMFAVKFINEFHGNYFHYGTSTVKDASNAVLETTTYSTPYVENNFTAKLITSGRYQVTVSAPFRSTKMTGTYSMVLTFNGNNCTVSAPAGSAYTISGTGEFKSKAYEWGNKKRDGIVLKYTVSNTTNKYEADEVMVARDRAVVMETYSPVIF